MTAFSIGEGEFFRTVDSQVAEGYNWTSIECREPNADSKHIAIETPTGNKYVCFKLVK